MKVNYNAQAIIANNKLKVNDNKLSESIGRLSTGLKIKNAKDNPSGLAMARRMNAQIEGMGVAGNSAKDGINIIKTADGVLNEIHDILQRMNELAVKGANGTLMTEDRDYIESEIRQLKDEIGRIASTTDFNGQTILDGTFDYRGYATVGGSTDPDIRVASYSDNMAGRKYTVANVTATYEDVLGDGKEQLVITQANRNNIKIYDDANDPSHLNPLNMTVKQVDGDLVRFEDNEGRELTISIRDDVSSTDIELDLTDIGPMTVQIGANEGQVLDMRVPAITLTSLGLYGLSVNQSVDNLTGSLMEGEAAARKAIDSIKNALNYVSELRSRLGAYQNRLEHTDANLDTTSENLTASYSQIMDVDMAEEMTNYSTQNVLSQAGISILSQANERASLALQLLQ